MRNLDLLKKAFIEVLSIDPASDFDGLAYGVTAGWDSVAHMALVAAIEEAFEIMLASDEVIDVSNFQKGKEIVSRHGIEFEA